MIVRWRRLFNSTWTRTFKTLGNPRIQPLPVPQLQLSPEIVDSTVSSCPSDTIALGFFLWCARQPSYFHVPASFDLMIPIVARLTDRFSTVEGIIEELDCTGCPKKAQSLMVLLRIYWRGGMFRMALEVFDEMGVRGFVPNTFARNMVLDVLFKTGHFDAAMEFFRETRFPNFLTFNTAICNLCKLNDWSRALGVLRAMVKGGFCPNKGTYLTLLNCFCKAGRIMHMLQLLAFMIVSGEKPSVNVWTIIIDGLCRVGMFDRAYMLLEKMVHTGCSPNVVTYTSVVKGFVRAGMHNKVFGILDAMLSKKCTPDLVLYNILIDSLSKVKRYDEAVEFFLCLNGSNIKPDSYTLSSLAPTLCLSGKMSLLHELVKGLDGSIDIVACNTLLDVFCKAGFPSLAVELYKDMIDKGMTPDNYSFVGLLNALCGLGQIDRAVNVYNAILVNNPDVDAHVHTAILDGLAKRGKYHRVVRLFRLVFSGDYQLDVVSYTIALHGLFRGGRFEHALNLFSHMKEIGVIPNIRTYNVMLHGLCKAREFNAVKQLLKDMGACGVELDCISFNIIIGLMFKLGRVRSGILLSVIMCDLEMKPNRDTYLLLHNSFASGEFDDLLPRLSAPHLKATSFLVSDESDKLDDIVLCSGG